MDPRHPHLARLLERQWGLASFEQLSEAGVPRGARRWRTQRGWRIVLPGVVAAFTGELTPRQRLLAALLYAGPEGALSSRTAAAWHGVTAADGDPRIHVLVGHNQRARSAGFAVVQRTSRPDHDLWSRPPLRIVSRPRAVVDAARSLRGEDRTRAVVIEAVPRGLVTPAALRHEVEAGAVRGSAAVRAAVQEAERGAWSVPEGDLFDALSTSSVLPEPWLNPGLRAADGTVLPTPDGWLDDVGLALQVHSRRHHALGEDWERTVQGDGVFAEYGIGLVAVTPVAIARTPDAVRARVERAYPAATRRPRPDVVATRAGLRLAAPMDERRWSCS